MKATKEQVRAFFAARLVRPVGGPRSGAWNFGAWSVTVELSLIDPDDQRPAKLTDEGRLWAVTVVASDVPAYWSSDTESLLFQLVDRAGRYVRWELGRALDFGRSLLVEHGTGATADFYFRVYGAQKGAGRWGLNKKAAVLAAAAVDSVASFETAAQRLEAAAADLRENSPRGVQYLRRAANLRDLAGDLQAIRDAADPEATGGGGEV